MTDSALTPTADLLDSRRIMRFFWPLAMSWLFMSVEGPACVSFISRLPDSVLHTAAFNLLMSLALFVESPVIDLLSTSTTLASSRANYLTIRRFVVGLMIIETVIHAAFVLTPLYNLVTLDLMHIPPGIAAAARVGLTFMIPWSACIGWRRFHQGILIRFGRTRAVGAGTFVRMSTLFGVSAILFVSGRATGAVIAGLGLICSVFAEAIYVHWATKSVIRDQFTEDSHEHEPISVSKLCRFHFPLTATTMVMFLGGPMISSALAQSLEREYAMSAWQVASSVLWITRAAVYALPEVVITLGRTGAQAARSLKAFCLKTGVLCSAIILVAYATNLDRAIFLGVLHASPETIDLVRKAFLLGLPLPFIASIQSYLRGMLTLHHRTTSRLFAIAIGLSTLAAMIQIGLAQRWSGVELAGYSMIAAQIAELAALWGSWRYGKDRVRVTEPSL